MAISRANCLPNTNFNVPKSEFRAQRGSLERARSPRNTRIRSASLSIVRQIFGACAARRNQFFPSILHDLMCVASLPLFRCVARAQAVVCAHSFWAFVWIPISNASHITCECWLLMAMVVLCVASSVRLCGLKHCSRTQSYTSNAGSKNIWNMRCADEQWHAVHSLAAERVWAMSFLLVHDCSVMDGRGAWKIQF